MNLEVKNEKGHILANLSSDNGEIVLPTNLHKRRLSAVAYYYGAKGRTIAHDVDFKLQFFQCQ